MLNLLNINKPVKVNGVVYPTSHAAYEALKDFDGQIHVIVGNVSAAPAQTASQPAKAKGSLMDAYRRFEGEAETPKVEEPSTTQYRIRVKKWMTEESSPGFDFMQKWNNDVPMPMVIMRGTILEETKGMYRMDLSATPEPSTHCFVCGRALKHPVSVLYGIGPECGGHFHINPLSSQAALSDAMDDIRAKMQAARWTGWVIKSAIKEMHEIDADTMGYEE